MKKPLFPVTKEVKVPGATRLRMIGVMSSWDYLTNIWLGFPPDTKELKQLIMVESTSRNRPYMLRRLIARLHTTERHELYRRLGL